MSERIRATVRASATLPRELHRRAKIMAVNRGCSLQDLIQEGLTLILETPDDRVQGLIEDGLRIVVDGGGEQ